MSDRESLPPPPEAAFTTPYKVAFGPVLQGKLPPGDPGWPAFNGSFRNVEAPQIEIMDALWTGHPITTWHKDHWRKGENYILGQHLGLDFDTKDEQSTIPHLLQDSFIRRYAAMVYTTPSHTPAEPRARVIFLLDTPIHQPENYKRASLALLWIFGAADAKCKDPVRFFYGGKPGACEMEWIGNELPLAKIKDLIESYESTGKRERKRQQGAFDSAPVDQARIADALRHVSPWAIDYEEWVSVLMAIHAELGDGGLGLAESWGDGREGEVLRKWRSFKPGGNSAGKVGIGTLFALAQDRGWRPS